MAGLRVPYCRIATIAMILLIGCSRPAPNTSADPVSPSAQPGSQPPKADPPATILSELPRHIWRMTEPASGSPGSIFIFVADGTLLETSCKETYRIARWSSDPRSPKTFEVVEDGTPAFTGTILESTPSSLRIERRLRRGETSEIKLEAVAGEFVCPDMR